MHWRYAGCIERSERVDGIIRCLARALETFGPLKADTSSGRFKQIFEDPKLMVSAMFCSAELAWKIGINNAEQD